MMMINPHSILLIIARLPLAKERQLITGTNATGLCRLVERENPDVGFNRS